MALWDERVDLGRVETGLRTIGFAIWAFVGFAHGVPGGFPRTWVWAWLLYGGAAFASFFRRRFPRWLAIGLLAAQALCVFSFPVLGFHGFEGLLLSIVAAQAPTVLSLRVAAAWAGAQLVPLLASVWIYQRPIERAAIAGAYSAFSFFALLVYWLQQSERLSRRSLLEAQLENLSARALMIEGVRQGERLRLSRELHDSLGHQLTALKLHLELAGRLAGDGVPEPVAKAQGIARTALSELRQVVGEMQADREIDLSAAVQSLAASLPAGTVSVEIPEGLALEAGTAHLLFRCVQEAITNSLKHGGGRIEVAVVAEAMGIALSVRDRGLIVPAVTPGRGLRGIEERVAQLGGIAEFGPAPDGGFQVRVRVPRRAA